MVHATLKYTHCDQIAKHEGFASCDTGVNVFLVQDFNLQNHGLIRKYNSRELRGRSESQEAPEIPWSRDEAAGRQAVALDFIERHAGSAFSERADSASHEASGEEEDDETDAQEEASAEESSEDTSMDEEEGGLLSEGEAMVAGWRRGEAAKKMQGQIRSNMAFH